MPEEPPRSMHVEITLLTMAAIVVVGQMYIVIPLFAPMGAAFGRPAADLAVTSSAFGVPYAFSGLVAGPLADVWGAKRVIVLSLMATAFTTSAVALAPSFASLAALRGIQGLTAGFLSAPLFAYIAREIEESARAFATTTIMAAAMSSAVLMQLFGQVVEGPFGWRSVFFAFAPVMLVLAFAANRLLARPTVTAGNRVAGAILTLLGILRRGRLLALYGAALTLLGGFVAVLSGVALYSPADLRAEPERLFLLRASALPVMVAAPFLALRLKGLSLRIRIVSGLGVSALSLGGAALGDDRMSVLALGLAVCVAGILIAAPAIVQGVAQAVPDASGAAVSLYTFAIFLGASLGPQFAVLLAPLGMTGLLIATALLFVAGAALGYGGIR